MPPLATLTTYERVNGKTSEILHANINDKNTNKKRQKRFQQNMFKNEFEIFIEGV